MNSHISVLLNLRASARRVWHGQNHVPGNWHYEWHRQQQARRKLNRPVVRMSHFAILFARRCSLGLGWAGVWGQTYDRLGRGEEASEVVRTGGPQRGWAERRRDRRAPK